MIQPGTLITDGLCVGKVTGESLIGKRWPVWRITILLPLRERGHESVMDKYDAREIEK